MADTSGLSRVFSVGSCHDQTSTFVLILSVYGPSQTPMETYVRQAKMEFQRTEPIKEISLKYRKTEHIASQQNNNIDDRPWPLCLLLVSLQKGRPKQIYCWLPMEDIIICGPFSSMLLWHSFRILQKGNLTLRFFVCSLSDGFTSKQVHDLLSKWIQSTRENYKRDGW